MAIYTYKGKDINITTDELDKLEPEITLCDNLYDKLESKTKEARIVEAQMDNDIKSMSDMYDKQMEAVYMISTVPFVIIKTLLEERNQ